MSVGIAFPVIRLVLLLVVGIFMAAALVVTIEPTTVGNFHTALYFVAVTITTVGFGDYTMKTVGRTAIYLVPLFSRVIFTLVSLDELSWVLL